MNKKQRIFKIVGWCILGIVFFLMYFPLVMVIVYSFSSSKTVGGSGSFTFSLYGAFFENEALMEATANTLIIGLASSLIATFLGTVSAVGIFYLKRGKAIVSGMSQITVVNAEIVTAVGFFLLFIFLRDVLHLPVEQGVGWLILAHTMITVPYVVLAVTPRLTQLNPNLFEAGQDLGASGVRTLFTVIVPQLVKGMISGFALSFTLSLDDFVVTKFNKGDVNTISTYVYDGLKRGLDPAVRALSTILFVTVMAVLIIVNIVGARRAAVKTGGKPAKKGAKA